MIRPFTCVCVLLAAGSGLYLYQTKHRSQMLDREIARVIKQTETVRERSGVLRGEWALLSEPDRLAELSRQHLGLKTLQPTQFVALADLGARLPAPLPAGSMAPPADEPVDLPPLTAAKLQQPQQVAAAPAPAPVPTPGARPVQVASAPASAPAPGPGAAAAQAAAAPGAPPAPPRPVKAAAPRPAEAPAPAAAAPIVQVAVAPIGSGRPAPVGAAAGNVIGESVARVARGLPPLAYRAEPGRPAQVSFAATPIAATPIGSAPPAARGAAAGTPIITAPVITGPMVGTPIVSALGGARAALPAPVPYTAQR